MTTIFGQLELDESQHLLTWLTLSEFIMSSVVDSFRTRTAASTKRQRIDNLNEIPMCVKMSDMIKTNIRQLQHHLSAVMRHVEHGEEVLITRRNRVVAKIIPAESQIERVDWPDFIGRAKAIVQKPKGEPASRIVIEDREQRT